MAENAPLDPRDFAELIIPDSAPRLRQRFPVLERVGVLWHALDTPLGVRRIGFRVQDVEDLRGGRQGRFDGEQVVFPWRAAGEFDDGSRGVHVESRCEGGLDETARGDPGGGEVVEVGEEFLAGDLRGGLEFGLGVSGFGRKVEEAWQRV